MKRILTLFLIVLSVFAVYGVAQSDSVKVVFALDKATFNPALGNNAASMNRFIDNVVAAANSGTLEHIDIHGYASPEGPFRNNDRLSRQRCNVIADFLNRNAGIPFDYIRTYPGGIAWEGLRALVNENHDTPSRDAVLDILDEYLPQAATDRAKSDQCRDNLMALDNGRTFKWMIENLFPRLRYSLAVYIFTTLDSVLVHTTDGPNAGVTDDSAVNLTDNSGNDEPPQNISVTPLADNALSNSNTEDTPSSTEDTPSSSHAEDTDASLLPPPVDFSNTPHYKPLHRLAVKTNLLYDAALLPNLEAEYRINDNWSVALEGGVAWWGSYARERSYRLAMLSPEVKRWIRPRAPWHGFYVGAFAGGGLYDFQKGTPGYSGEGVMGGLSVGYMWPLTRCLSLEAEVGAGYLFTRYKEYKPIDGHHVYQRTKEMNYFGPLKVKFSLVWRLWDINKPRRAGVTPNNGAI